jgi:hypothetical protein
MPRPPAGHSPGVHRAAAEGHTADADSHVRGRPDYPPALAGWLTGAPGLRAGASVVPRSS